jgi:hypothetical protein
MDIAYELAQYLDTANFGTIGTDIFVGHMPADTDGIYILRTGGTLNNYLPVEETVLDIYYVHTSAQTAVGALENIKRYIHRMHTTYTSDAFIFTMLALGDVEDVARDVEYKKIFKLTIQVVHRDTGVIS